MSIRRKTNVLPSVSVCVCTGNPSQHSGLIHAAVPEHAVAVGRSVGPRGGSDALPIRPVQVSVRPLSNKEHKSLTLN